MSSSGVETAAQSPLLSSRFVTRNNCLTALVPMLPEQTWAQPHSSLKMASSLVPNLTDDDVQSVHRRVRTSAAAGHVCVKFV